MLELIVAPLARQDMIDISDHIAKENRAAALRVVGRFETAMLRLLDMPFVGPAAGSHLPADIRKFSSPPYIIFYRVLPGQVQVVRILHASRDIDVSLLR